MEILFAEEREYEFEETTRSDEVLSNGGIKKQLMLKRLKEREEEKAIGKFLRTPPKAKDEKYALSFKIQNYVGNCLPGETQDKIFNLFKGRTNVKLGKLRPNDKNNDKTKFRYNGWINFFSVGDCHRAMEAIRNNEAKTKGMQIVKIGKVRELVCEFSKKKKEHKRVQPASCYNGDGTQQLVRMVKFTKRPAKIVKNDKPIVKPHPNF